MSDKQIRLPDDVVDAMAEAQMGFDPPDHLGRAVVLYNDLCGVAQMLARHYEAKIETLQTDVRLANEAKEHRHKLWRGTEELLRETETRLDDLAKDINATFEQRDYLAKRLAEAEANLAAEQARNRALIERNERLESELKIATAELDRQAAEIRATQSVNSDYRKKLSVAQRSLKIVDLNISSFDYPGTKIPACILDCLDGRHGGNGSDQSEDTPKIERISPSVRYALSVIHDEKWKGKP